MKHISLILLLNLFCLSHLLLIFDITPFNETEIKTDIPRNGIAYFKINLKEVKEEDKNNLYIQYRTYYFDANQYFTVDVCSFSEEPSEDDINAFKDSINDIQGTKNPDSYYYYYKYKIPKFENNNWLVIRTSNRYTYNYDLILKSFYVYSEKEEENKNLSWNISITVISAVNTILLVLILFIMLTSKKESSMKSIDKELIPT